MRALAHFLKEVRGADSFNPEVQLAPDCFLCPSRDRQWEAVIPVIQAELSQLMILAEKRVAQQHEAQT